MFIAIDAFTAFTADDVVMMAFIGVMVDEFIIHLAFEYAVQPLKQLQRAVDRRFIDAGHFTLNGSDDLLSCEVGAGFVYDIQNQPSLGGQFKPFLF